MCIRDRGYIERDFDDELGVNKDYQGQGFTSKLSPALLLNFLRVALKTQKVTKTLLHQAPDKLQELRQQSNRLHQEIRELNDQSAQQQVESLWKLVLNQAYLDSEGTYFWQAYINTCLLYTSSPGQCRSDYEYQQASGIGGF